MFTRISTFCSAAVLSVALVAPASAIAQTVGKDQACTAVIDKVIIIYSGPDLADVTSSLVSKYNAQYPGR